jgi:hypothetical protein
MIRIYETFEIVTPESAADSDAAARGWIMNGASSHRVGLRTTDCPPAETLSFRECVELLRGTEASCSAPELRDVRAWATAYRFRENHETGAEESRSYHPASARDARWFWRAYRVANDKKGVRS